MTNENQKNAPMFDACIWDVATAAHALGTSEKAIRAMVARRVIPFRRLNRKIIFVKKELIEFLADLPGCNKLEAKQNLQKKKQD